MSLTNFPNGISAFGVPILPQNATGEIFFVDDSGSNDNTGKDTNNPFADIDYAVGRCTAGRGDTIYAMEGHAETKTAAIALDVIGVSIIGLGQGGLKPAITGNGTIDVINITAANCRVENLNFPGPLTDVQTADINIAAAGCVIRNTRHIGSVGTENKVSLITVTAAGENFIIEGVVGYNATVEVPQGINLEGVVANGIVRYCSIMGTFTNGALVDGATCTLLRIYGNTFKNDKAAAAVLAFSNNSTGVCHDNRVSGRHTTIASNITTGTGMDFFETFVVEEPSLNGILIPLVDAD